MSDKIKQVQLDKLYDIEPAVSSTLQVDNAAPTLAWNTTSVVGTVDGVDLTVKLPAQPAHQTIKQDGITGATVNRFGTCSTSATNKAKDVSITTGTFNLEAGARVAVKFTNANLSENPTLNVNSTGAKAIFHNGAKIQYEDSRYLLKGVCEFVYDGTQWHFIGNSYVSSETAASGGTTVSLVTTGEKYTWNNKTSNTGTVTSVRVQATNPVVSSSNTAQTSTLNTTISLADGYGDTKNPYASKTANYVLAAPNGSAGVPAFRALVAADIPSLAASKITSMTGYSKPSSTSAITTTDTLNTAIGKLEKALDGKQASGSYLTSHQTIKQDGITGATINRFGTCSTAAATVAKTVSVTTGTFSLETGARVSVKFSNANTASTPTLNVNSKGAKNIYYKGAQITTGNSKELLAGVCDFVYDGTQ